MKAGNVTVDENGDYTAEEPQWVLWSKGREETNGSGSIIETADMKIYKFHSLVQLPAGTPKVSEGTRVLVSDSELTQVELRLYGSLGHGLDDSAGNDIFVNSGNDENAFAESRKRGIVRIVGVCAKFDRGQLHCRMWL